MEAISQHISYSEAVNSYTAKRLGIDNTPNANQLSKMKLLAEKVFEPLRLHFGIPIYVASFFRSAALNVAVGGAINSQHMAGEAMDIDVENAEGVDNKDIFEYIKDNLQFDQLIAENIKPDGSIDWVHVSYKAVGNRKQVLTMVLKDGKKIYEEVV